MTLAQIMKLALRQLGEDEADIDEYAELFREYANMGYRIAVRDYLKPRETYTLYTDNDGRTSIEGMDVVRVIELRSAYGNRLQYELEPDGYTLRTPVTRADVTAVCEVMYPGLQGDMDTPRLPESAHMALVDYICYCHLSNGNMAKQSRAQFYQGRFYSAMREIPTQGGRTVTDYRNLYLASDARYTRW